MKNLSQVLTSNIMAMTIFKLTKPRIVFKRSLIRRLSTHKLTEKDVEEIQIPISWGHISGKWWGSRDKQPILCVHGWQDNANSFDTLIPQLPSEFSYLAIDMPGHGFSSHIPKGIFYKISDTLATLRRIQQHLKCEKLSIISHSLGAIVMFIYSTIFTNDVNFLVAIDTIKPLSRDIDNEVDKGSESVEKLLKYDSLDTSTAVGYSKEDIIKLWLEGTNNSVTEESCKILLQRGVTEKNGLFTLRRDPKLKNSFLTKIPKKQTLEMARNISCSVLYIKAADWPYFEKKQDVIDVLEVIKKKAKYFEEHKLPGSHHLHLNNPEVVAPVISAFIKSIPVG